MKQESRAALLITVIWLYQLNSDSMSGILRKKFS